MACVDQSCLSYQLVGIYSDWPEVSEVKVRGDRYGPRRQRGSDGPTEREVGDERARSVEEESCLSLEPRRSGHYPNAGAVPNLGHAGTDQVLNGRQGRWRRQACSQAFDARQGERAAIGAASSDLFVRNRTSGA